MTDLAIGAATQQRIKMASFVDNFEDGIRMQTRRFIGSALALA